MGAKRRAQRAVTKPTRRSWNRLWPWTFGGVVVVGVAVVAYGIVHRPPYPRVGAHWHAPFSVEVCGRALSFPPSPGNVHTHGDGIIHVHPETEEEARAATLETFFRSIGVSISEGVLVLPDGRKFRNGDPCSGQPGRLRLSINGREMAVREFLQHYPQNGDQVRVSFD